jgi:hypothetical protein
MADFLLKVLPDTAYQKKTNKSRPHQSEIEECDIGTEKPQSLKRSAIGTQKECAEITSTSPLTEIFEQPKLHERRVGI